MVLFRLSQTAYLTEDICFLLLLNGEITGEWITD